MATRTKSNGSAAVSLAAPGQAQYLPAEQDEENALFDELETEDAGDRVASLLDMAAAEGVNQVRVSRFDGGKSVFCANYTPAEFERGNYEMIREQFGPGKYKVVLYGHDSQGNYGIRKRAEVELAEVKISKAQVLGMPAPGASDGAMTAILTAMAAQQARSDEMFAKILERPQVDPMAQFVQNLSLMTQMKDLFGGGQKSTVSELVDAIKELRGASDLINPEKGEKSESLIGMGSKLIEALPGLMAGMKGQSGAAPSNAGPTSAPMPLVHVPPSLAGENPAGGDPATPMPTDTPPNEDEEMNLLAMASLQGQLAKLTIMARTNRDIEDAAEFVAAELPEELIPVLEDDGWFAALTQFAPLLRSHQTWLTSVRDRALVLMDEDEPSDPVATQTEASAPAPAPKP